MDKTGNEAGPLVSVVTPVYNGEKYLKECIESVIDQTYQNFEYIIVNNSSTDGTGQIAESYQKKDSRIRVYHTSELLPIMKNWNYTMSLISQQSVYCKVVHADDFLFPDCVEAMTAFGEEHRNVGVIGAYSLVGDRMQCDGVDYRQSVIPGNEVCRRTLLGDYYLFRSPSCLMIRSDLIRKKRPFYHEAHIYADVEVLYELLKSCDFGFVHQVLTYIRRHADSVTSKVAKPVNHIILNNLHLLKKYGPHYLSKDEFGKRYKKKLDDYYRFLSLSALKLRGKKFWNFHSTGLRAFGLHLDMRKVMLLMMVEFLKHPFRCTEILGLSVIRKFRAFLK